jgi:hypothetical protein
MSVCHKEKNATEVLLHAVYEMMVGPFNVATFLLLQYKSLKYCIQLIPGIKTNKFSSFNHVLNREAKTFSSQTAFTK